MNKILAMGSCRVQSTLRRYKRFKDNSIELYLFFPLQHTLEQHIQSIFILQSDSSTIIEEDVFDMRWGDAKCCEITKENNIGKKIDIDFIDTFVIEICGLKNYFCEHGFYLHPFPQFYTKHRLYKVKYSTDFELKLKELNSLINHKQLILVSNHNIYKKKYRAILNKELEKFASNTPNVKFWNPTELIKKEGIKKCLKDENHFTDYMSNLQAEKIMELINE